MSNIIIYNKALEANYIEGEYKSEDNTTNGSIIIESYNELYLRVSIEVKEKIIKGQADNTRVLYRIDNSKLKRRFNIVDCMIKRQPTKLSRVVEDFRLRIIAAGFNVTQALYML